MNHQYPNESAEYRKQRDALAAQEKELISRVKAVAEQRRKLPLGGELKEDYAFTWANNQKLGTPVRFSELFGNKDTLLLYSFMFGPSWDKPCPSCTSIVDGFDRMAYQVGQDAAFSVVAKATAQKINTWANARGWSQIELVSGSDCTYQADYGCQRSDEHQIPKMNVFKMVDGKVFHYWGSEIRENDIDMIWPYWNLMDLTPAGRPDRPNPPQNFRAKYFEENYSN